MIKYLYISDDIQIFVLGENMDDRVIRFGKKSEPFFELSPYHYRTFIIGNRKWRTLIHYWYASCFSDTEMREVIRNIDTPENVILRCGKMGLKDLNQVDSRFIINGILNKLSQNKDIKNVLFTTSGYELIYDGFGYLADDNRYGRLLMELREKYKKK